jgi:hemolysin activation/secretion protein
MFQLAAAQAQSVPPLTIDEGLRRQEERTREQQRELQTHPDELRPAASAAAIPELPDERPCFVVREIAFAGPDALRFRWLAASADAFVGRCVGAKGISRIAAYLDAQLIDQGHVTSRVSIGAQNLREGRLAFQLHVGRIAEVRMRNAEDHAPDTRWGTWINAFPTTAGRRLDARDLEQGVEQMKRLPCPIAASSRSNGRRAISAAACAAASRSTTPAAPTSAAPSSAPTSRSTTLWG